MTDQRQTTDAKMARAIEFVRDCGAIMGQQLDEATVLLTAAKVVKSMPRYPHRERHTP